MQSFKTTLMHEVVNDLTKLGKQVHVFKKFYDDRPGFTQDHLSSRVYTDGNDIAAAPIYKGPEEIIAKINSGEITSGHIIAMTEIQFIDEDDENAAQLQELYNVAAENDIGIISEGLDSWFNGEPTSQMQVAMTNSNLVAVRAAWDDSNPELLAPMSARFVKFKITEPATAFPNGNQHEEFEHYKRLHDKGMLETTIAEYIQKVLETGDSGLIDAVINFDEGTVLMMSHNRDKKRAVGLDQYKALSVDHYNTLYSAAGIEHHFSNASCIDLYELRDLTTLI